MCNAESRLSDSSRIPALHFFLWAAIIDRGEEGDFQTLSEEYLPKLAPNQEAQQKLFNRLYGSAFTDTAGAMAVLSNSAAVLGCGRDHTLERLWSALRDHNESAHRRGTEWNIGGGLNSLREYLDGWDETCRAMLAVSRSPLAMDLCAQLDSGVKQIVLTGAPGTGKTYLSRQIAQCMGAAWELVQFHPSYDYTDFVEGLRPVELEEGQGAAFVRLDGTFKSFCRRAAAEPEKLYFFLIDEINRADLSKVFGELMYCLESDKRGPDHRVQTQYRNLPAYLFQEGRVVRCTGDIFAGGFYIPENVVILATMNDIDRSVESMDFALRRRFTWLEAEVNRPLLEDAFQYGGFVQVLRDNAGEAARQVMALNQVICPQRESAGPFGLNRQYYISQGQFSGLPEQFSNLDELLRFVWDVRISSLLREYVRGENSRQTDAFLNNCRSAFLTRRPGT